MDAMLDHDRRLIDKLVREIARAEVHAIEHAARETRRLGLVPPVDALREVASHATSMRPRFALALTGHALHVHRRTTSTFGALRELLFDRSMDPERAFRVALLDLRHALEVVEVTRDASRRVGMFGVIRWCDDWLATRRTLVARAEAQLAWFEEHELLGELDGSTDAPDLRDGQ